MKCEHAQEFFSEYIEQSLDKPTGVALEAHLTACGGCRRGVEGLRQTWAALGAVPAVEPPKDLAWRVMVQLQQERLERLEAERKPRNPFTAWLQSLTPGAAFGYATLTALLIVAGLFPLRGAIEGISFGWKDDPRIVSPDQRATPANPANELAVTLPPARQEAPNTPWYYPLVVTVPPAMGESRVTISPLVMVNGQLSGTQVKAVTLAPGQTRMIPVELTVGTQPVRAIMVRAQGGGRSVEKVLSVPEFGGRDGF